MDRAVEQIAVPAAARKLSTLGRIDYEDGFTVEMPAVGERTAEEWARTIVEGAPGSLRQSLPRAWRALGLKHGPIDSDELVLGWPVRTSTADVALLGADSWIGLPGEILFMRERRSLFFATFIRKDNLLARAMWAGVEHQHRRVVAFILERGTRGQRLDG